MTVEKLIDNLNTAIKMGLLTKEDSVIVVSTEFDPIFIDNIVVPKVILNQLIYDRYKKGFIGFMDYSPLKEGEE